MKFLIPAILIFITTALNAAEIKLAVITSEFDKNVTDFYIETNDLNHIESMRYVTTMPNGGIFEDVTVPAERVIAEGSVIVERNGYQAVRLEVENFSVATGGIVKLNYLYSGVTGARHVKRLKLIANSGQFILTDTSDARVNRLFVKVNWVRVLGAVGVREILTSYVE